MAAPDAAAAAAAAAIDGVDGGGGDGDDAAENLTQATRLQKGEHWLARQKDNSSSFGISVRFHSLDYFTPVPPQATTCIQASLAPRRRVISDTTEA